MFDEITYEALLDDALSHVPDTVDKREGSIIYDAIAPCCFELYLMYQALSSAFEQSFPDTATGDYLDRIAEARGLIRMPASYAVMTIQVTPASADLSGKTFAANGLTYTVTESAGEGLWNMTCATAGTEGNSIPLSIIPDQSITGLLTCEYYGFASYAEDEETDEELRERYFESVQGAYFGGNEGDYKSRVAAMNNVGGVLVERAINGPGTVGIYITNADYLVPTPTDVAEVQAEVEKFAPIGHIPFVHAAASKSISVTMTVEFSPAGDSEQIRNAVAETVSGYLSEIRYTFGSEPYYVVRIAEMLARIMQVSGVNDVTDITMNEAEDNVMLDSKELPVLGTITINGVVV